MEQEKLNVETIIIDSRDKLDYVGGKKEANFNLLSETYEVSVACRGKTVKIAGKPAKVKQATEVLNSLIEGYNQDNLLNTREIKKFIKGMAKSTSVKVGDFKDAKIEVMSALKVVYSKTAGQKEYVETIKKNDVVFSTGPAGTGKTFLAVALAVDCLKKDMVSRIILCRPAVEAGENLGFLPGDLKEKIAPFLRPLYDALYETAGYEHVQDLMAKNIIEICPLAYMRGRTLNDAFIILDEAQNVTAGQLKMFLTRLGFNSKMVINGDITQIDLPKGSTSGLKTVPKILKGIEGIGFCSLSQKDIVRHNLVMKIVKAFEKSDRETKK